MNNIEQNATRLHALFSGLQRVHGEHIPTSETREDGKAQGSSQTKQTGPTVALWQQHLEGKQGLGIVPIRDDNTCVFGAVDIDVYADLDHAAIAHQLQDMGLPLVPCRSKSGGCHIYLFLNAPASALAVWEKLREIAAALGHGKAEAFPKQSRIEPRENGSWLNMPFFGGDESTRRAVRPDGTVMSTVEFLDHAETSKVSAEFFLASNKAGNKTGSKDPLQGGPPCLNNLVRIGIPPGGRNEFLSNMARYAKRANPSGWREDVESYNRGCCEPPLDHTEVGNVLKGAAGKEYNYSCSREPLASHCNRGVCRMRKFGVGNTGETFPEFGTLTKYVSDPPVQWVWEVDGMRLPLSTDQLLNYRLFQKACVEHLTKTLPDMKANEWKQHVAKAFETVHEEQITDDASDQGQFWFLLEKFCIWGRAMVLEEITLGKSFTDNGRTYFRLSDLRQFLEKQRFRDLSPQQMAAILKERGGSCKIQRLDKHEGTHRVWSIPAFGVQTEAFDVPDSIKNDTGPY